MNKTYFIILLVFFFIIYIKKIHGCDPDGSPCHNRSVYTCGAQVIRANLLPNSVLDMTVQSPDLHNNLGVSAIGHFTMHIDNGGGYRFLHKPEWVNNCYCDRCENIPVNYTFEKEFDLPTPPRGTWFDIWITIYWSCLDTGITLSCAFENVHYRGYVK
ncbi:hypothetical protein GLOIN_2v1778638 [Rhizophagus irregularis DAOM 181602=DAOM 197198]|uniref:Uncharacterized protein n=2 Tax=Rhizophagus irregularis TaxID=588596 RepID=A0A2P4PRV0_RHIID|nr:hypothetical protein GLOIN_2v1778638 [Rhizophagus irregularis DAOM 181602=DAOM 197198]POG68129.1 hypothetical protein GLOIN_2v1778638 [Rhizophagus irregularis DAOM 181602=DAOM 197198]GBC31780.2 hypothetical protein GLOIN_2v1778638 [Rhizophagus irregularis DAOM 181602=DAOM 197198]|eukprot:XP_025174995.1 hypothetical protein GLOIN_2v1778638 [Rhizophagus irregularis DAOM 181602=DAOM 197198]